MYKEAHVSAFMEKKLAFTLLLQIYSALGFKTNRGCRTSLIVNKTHCIIECEPLSQPGLLRGFPFCINFYIILKMNFNKKKKKKTFITLQNLGITFCFPLKTDFPVFRKCTQMYFILCESSSALQVTDCYNQYFQ